LRGDDVRCSLADFTAAVSIAPGCSGNPSNSSIIETGKTDFAGTSAPFHER
jgi:hypothetical protein